MTPAPYELAIFFTGDWLEEAVFCWLQEAQQEANVHRRVRGYLSNDLAWMTPSREGIGRGPRYAPEAPPPRGGRNRRLVEDGCIVAAIGRKQVFAHGGACDVVCACDCDVHVADSFHVVGSLHDVGSCHD